MNTPILPTCAKCGFTLPVDAPKGLCPRCLAAMNFATETVFTGADALAAQPPLSPTEITPHFPQLEIVECLGRGGMGVVYKARQKSLNRVVALKLLAPERVADAKFAKRFAHEAQALATLNHPSIVTVYDFGQAGGFFYLLMEFVDGVNLRQAMKAGRFTPEQALAIVPPVCEALQYAHEHGIVHRDIKPENLLLDRAGRVKIADFGIAKILGVESSSAGIPESQPAGTPQYMAPEQKAHHGTDHRADIYSLGVVIYEMLTGELPEDKLQPPSRKVQIDVRLDAIVVRALEKTPELRYQTAGELRTQVETLAMENGFVPRRGSDRRVVPWVVGVLLFVFAVIAIFAFVTWRHFRIAEASKSAEGLPQNIKQQNGKPDSSATTHLEEEIIRLARKRLDQTRQSYEAKQVSLSEVEEAEGELALAEARHDQLKRSEARLTMATKYLERIEKLFRTGNIGEAEYNHAKQRKLEAQLEKADALRNADEATSSRNTEDEIIRLARERLDLTYQQNRAQIVSLSQVDEAEGELAVAEARGDLRKRAEARLTMATKYLERIGSAHRAGEISDAEYSQAKQRKLEAELELQRVQTFALPKAEKSAGATPSSSTILDKRGFPITK
jgi:serine/threonine protein kinase